jgi:hypothetical protein
MEGPPAGINIKAKAAFLQPGQNDSFLSAFHHLAIIVGLKSVLLCRHSPNRIAHNVSQPGQGKHHAYTQ